MSWSPIAVVIVVLMAVTSCAGPQRPREPSWRQIGFALPTWSQAGYADPAIATYVEEMSDAGGRWVQLTPTYYQSSTSSSDIRPTQETANDDGLVAAIRTAHQGGLRVMLKPVVDVGGAPGSQADIRPADLSAWFAGYRRFIDHYALLAARTGVQQFSVGNELLGVSGERDAWLRIIAGVRSAFHGSLVYAANFNEYPRVSFWDALDLIGVDAYWSLSTHPTTDVAALRRAWAPISAQLGMFAEQQHKRILFTEAGYTSTRGTTTLPYSWQIGSVADPNEQAAAYEALLAEFEDKQWWGGVLWWVWNVVPDQDGEHSQDFTIRGKPAEDVVRRFWASGQ